MKNGTTFRVDFVVERKGQPVRKSIEGKDLEKLLAKVEKLDGYQVVVSKEMTS